MELQTLWQNYLFNITFSIYIYLQLSTDMNLANPGSLWQVSVFENEK